MPERRPSVGGTVVLGILVQLLFWLPIYPLGIWAAEVAPEQGVESCAFGSFHGLGIYATMTSFAVTLSSMDGFPGAPGWLLIGLLATTLLHAGNAVLIHRLGSGGRWRDAWRAGLARLPAIARLTLVGALVLVFGNGVVVAVSFPLSLVWPIGALILGILVAPYWLALPALVLEGRGAFRALKRSRELTRGARLRTFGRLLLFFVGPVVVSTFHAFLARADDGPASGVAAMVLLGAVFGSLRACVQTRVYLGRRDALEGPSVDRLRAVFE